MAEARIRRTYTFALTAERFDATIQSYVDAWCYENVAHEPHSFHLHPQAATSLITASFPTSTSFLIPIVCILPSSVQDEPS